MQDERRKTEDGRPKTEGRLDVAIDRAVREMLDVEPPAGLRGRVIERIERPGRLSGRWTWALVPVTAAAIVVLAIVMPSRQPAAVPVHGVAAKAPGPATLPSPVASAAAAAAATTTVPTVPDRAVRTASANRTRVVVATSASTGDASEESVERLASIDPIGIRAIGPSGISQPDVSISPLASIPQIRVELLSPPDGRN